jgi:hypothetical protein
MDATGPSAILSAMSERDRRVAIGYPREPEDVPRLIGAVRVALERHEALLLVRLEPCAEHEHWRGPLVGDNDNLAVRRACSDCRVFDEPYCGSCVGDDGRFQDWPCGEYQAITRELTGEAQGG